MAHPCQAANRQIAPDQAAPESLHHHPDLPDIGKHMAQTKSLDVGWNQHQHEQHSASLMHYNEVGTGHWSRRINEQACKQFETRLHEKNK